MKEKISLLIGGLILFGFIFFTVIVPVGKFNDIAYKWPNVKTSYNPKINKYTEMYLLGIEMVAMIFVYIFCGFYENKEWFYENEQMTKNEK